MAKKILTIPARVGKLRIFAPGGPARGTRLPRPHHPSAVRRQGAPVARRHLQDRARCVPRRECRSVPGAGTDPKRRGSPKRCGSPTQREAGAVVVHLAPTGAAVRTCGRHDRAAVLDQGARRGAGGRHPGAHIHVLQVRRARVQSDRRPRGVDGNAGLWCPPERRRPGRAGNPTEQRQTGPEAEDRRDGHGRAPGQGALWPRPETEQTAGRHSRKRRGRVTTGRGA